MLKINLRILTLFCLITFSFSRIQTMSNPSTSGSVDDEQSITFEILRGEDISKNISGIDALRVQYYADFPYYYDRSADTKKIYLNVPSLVNSGFVIVAKKDGVTVGTITARPVTRAFPLTKLFHDKLTQLDYEADTCCFAGKPVVIPKVAHQGLESALLAQLLLEAKKTGYTSCCTASLDVESVFLEIPETFIDVATYIEKYYEKLPTSLKTTGPVKYPDGTKELKESEYSVWRGDL